MAQNPGACLVRGANSVVGGLVGCGMVFLSRGAIVGRMIKGDSVLEGGRVFVVMLSG